MDNKYNNKRTCLKDTVKVCKEKYKRKPIIQILIELTQKGKRKGGRPEDS